MNAPPEVPLLGEHWPLATPLALSVLGLVTALATASRLSAPSAPLGLPGSGGAVSATAAPPPTSPPTAAPSTAVPPPSAAPTAPVDCAPTFAVRFAPGRAEPTLDPAAARRLSAWLDAHPAARLIVNGHADVHGSVASNLALSHRRAQAVVAALVTAGAPRDRLTPRGFGAYAPVPGAPAADQANRRVDFELGGLPGIGPCPDPSPAP
jgi:outer membrane protein OmpA-like peptidoglycan-associated protein